MHPQHQQFLEMLRRFLAKLSGVVVVYEPESSVRIDFLYLEKDEDDGAATNPVMRFQLTPARADREADAIRMGLPKPQMIPIRSSFGPHAGKTIHLRRFVCPIESPEQGAAMCFQTLEKVLEIRSDQWLWITDIWQHDDWPSPLPRPEIWPPSVMV